MLTHLKASKWIDDAFIWKGDERYQERGLQADQL